MGILDRIINKWDTERRLGKQWMIVKVLGTEEQLTISTAFGVLTFDKRRLHKKTEMVGIYTKSTIGKVGFRIGKMTYHYIDYKEYRLVIFSLKTNDGDP